MVEGAADAGVTLRVLGGVAVGLRCPSAARPPLARAYGDVDLMGLSAQAQRAERLLETLGCTPEPRFNAVNGHRRLMFHDAEGRTVDVLLDRFEMCHTLDLRDRLALDPLTLTPADLLLTKLQVVEAAAKDDVDALALLVDHDLGSGPDAIDDDYVAGLCGRDWGLATSVEASLARLEQRADMLDDGPRGQVAERIGRLRERLAAEPKSARGRARARVGTRVRWYRVPEEVT
jgi:hypothetical protein